MSTMANRARLQLAAKREAGELAGLAETWIVSLTKQEVV